MAAILIGVAGMGTVSAQAPTWFPIAMEAIGVIVKVGNGIRGLIGSTEVRPHIRIDSWKYTEHEVYAGSPRSHIMNAGYSAVTGQWWFRQTWTPGGQSSEAFTIPSVARWSYHCDRTVGTDVGNVFWSRISQDFSTGLWAEIVKKTGLFSSSGPFIVEAITTATRLQPACDPIGETVTPIKVSFTAVAPGSGKFEGENLQFAWPPILNVKGPARERSVRNTVITQQ